MEDKIKEILATILEIDQSEVNNETSPDTVSNWDSLRHMKLVFAIEEEYEIEFSDDQIIQLIDVGKIISCIKELV
jgi:acyl carrier protein